MTEAPLNSISVDATFYDDVRDEVGNKASLIGHLDREVGLKAYPAVLPKFWTRVRVSKNRSMKVRTMAIEVILAGVTQHRLSVDPAVLKDLQETTAPSLSRDAFNIQFCASPFFVEKPSLLQVICDVDGQRFLGGEIAFEQTQSAPEDGLVKAAMPAPISKKRVSSKRKPAAK